MKRNAWQRMTTAAVILLASAANAGDRAQKEQADDRIDVIASVAPTGKTVASATHASRKVIIGKAAIPRVVRSSSGVTAMRVDESRGLIYVVDPEGLHILQQHSALDTELRKEYERQLLYNR